VRYERVLGRLTPFPALLPPPGEALLPVVLDDRARDPRVPPPGLTPKAAAVLVLIHPDEDGEARVVLTERARRAGHHSGEASFPGGRAEPGDDGPAGGGLFLAKALGERLEVVAGGSKQSGTGTPHLSDNGVLPGRSFSVWSGHRPFLP